MKKGLFYKQTKIKRSFILMQKENMLNLFNLKEKYINNYTGNKKPGNVHTDSYNKSTKHFPSSIREWDNSIYTYNKNSISLVPHTTNIVTKMIKDYFNLYNKHLEQKMRTKKLFLRLRRVSSNKFYVSNGGLKHTNNKVYINLFVFNRQKTNHLLTLRKWFLSYLLKTNKENSNLLGTTKIAERIKSINNKGIKNLVLLNKNKYLLIKTFNVIKKNNKYNINRFKSIIKYTENFYKKLINKSMKKIRMYFYYKQLVYLNKSKLNYTYLQYLKTHLENIYNKNVEFNIINLKKFYLNSDILSESMTLKLIRSRRKMVKLLNVLKNKVNTRKSLSLVVKNNEEIKIFRKHNLSINNIYLQNHVINSLKYRHITGFRLEAKGRLTKRFTASRSMSKFRYKGNLLNIDSSYKGLSSVLLKGNLKPNTQHTTIRSKSRIGSFGIKGWISGN